MQIRSKALTFGQIQDIIERVSREHYASNVRPHQDARALYANGRGYVGRIDTHSSREPGARKSWAGRRTNAACWHAFRDIYRAIFDADPMAIVVSMYATFYGPDHERARVVQYSNGEITGVSGDFEQSFEFTGNIKIGSVFAPAYMPDLCECEA